MFLFFPRQLERLRDFTNKIPIFVFSKKKIQNCKEFSMYIFLLGWKCLEDSIKEVIYKLIALISRISLVLVRGKSVKFLKTLGPLMSDLIKH